MPLILKDAIEDIYQVWRKKPDMHTKADVYRAIVKELNSIASGGWTYPYIANLHRGDQLDSVSKKMRFAIKKMHKGLKPKRIVSPDTVCIRTLKIMSDEYELHEIQERLGTRKRTEKLMTGWHYHDVDEFYED